MFWTYNTTSPQIDIILCKEDLTLQELLDQENVLQELKAQNLKLIEFLIKPEILRELVNLITTEPSPDIDEADQYKYPNLACELLTSDLPALNERLASEEILSRLYCFLQNDPPLNPLLSSYFSRTLSILISRKSEQNWFSYQYTCLQALEFLKAKEEFIELLLKHMGTSSIMDLVHNLVTLIEGPELKQSLWNWLQSQNVIPSLINLLNPHSDTDCQANAASALCSIIQKLRENLADMNERSESDPILSLLESSHITELLLSTIFASDVLCETSIEYGIDVLLAIMQPYLPGDARCRQMLNYTVHDRMDSGLVITSNSPASDNTKNAQPTALSDIIAAVLPYIKTLRDVLLNPIKTEPVKLTSGVISPPFGKARLLVAKFVGILISLNSSEINKEIMHCDIPELLLDLFYAYSSNNFLHTEVEKLLAYAIDNVSEYAVKECNDDLFFSHILKKCNLLKRILNVWEENSEREKDGFYRRGYMGHVIRIASLIHIEDEKNLVFHELLAKEVPADVLSEWIDFVKNSLIAIIEIHSSCLGGIRPKLCQSNDNSFEETISNRELKTSFKVYDQDDDQNVIFSNDPSIMNYDGDGYDLNNDLTEEDMERQAKMFNVVCAQKWQSFTKGLDSLDDNDDDIDDRISMWRNQGKAGAFRLWDSDDENFEEDLESSPNPWAKLGSVSDPWGNNVGGNESADSADWNANVSSDWANFEENFNDSDAMKEGDAESRSTLATNAEQQYSLFGSGAGTNDKSAASLLSNKTTQMDSAGQFDNRPELVNGEWPADTGVGDSIGKDESRSTDEVFTMQQTYNCYGEPEMLHLESISGNTLAEKIANAENDIRNEDEIRLRGMHEQRQSIDHEATAFGLMNRFGGVTVRVDGELADETVVGDDATEPNPVFLSQQDCLTENSIDFVTADNNSTSDAESSVEFGDAENSLELEEEEEEELAEKTDGSATTEEESTILEVAEAGGYDACSDQATAAQKVPKISKFSEECDAAAKTNCADVAEQENSGVSPTSLSAVGRTADVEKSIEGKSCPLVNGDAEAIGHKMLTNCDKPNDAYDNDSLPKEEFDGPLNGTVIEEPA